MARASSKRAFSARCAWHEPPDRSQAGPARVRLIFENGDITRIEADDRSRVVGHRIVPTRWQGRCCDYREMDGYRIPTRAVVSWLLDEGPFEYWRGRVTAFRMK